MKALKYLLQAPMTYYHMFALVETHKLKTQFNTIRNKFMFEAKRHISFNAAHPSASSELGSHGGEMLAWRRHLNISPVDPSVLSQLAVHTMQPVSIAACIVRFKHFSLVLVTHLFT